MSMLPQLPSPSALLSDTALYSGSIFNEFLPWVLLGAGISLAGILVIFIGRAILHAGNKLLGHKDEPDL